jgi:hypothetical protein
LLSLPYEATKTRARSVPPLAKLADTLAAEFMVTTQAPMPLQAPPQPVKMDPDARVAVRLTGVPLAKFAAQAALQLMPAGALVTVPLPVTVTDKA